MATVGQRGHINPSQGRPGLELLLTNVSGYSATRATGSQPYRPFSCLAAIPRARQSWEFICIGYTHRPALKQAKTRQASR